jgi:sugar phosphate permease
MQTVLEDVSRRARRRAAQRLLPFVFLLYLICYIDRANLSFANLRMSVDLGFSDRIYGLGAGLFFIGYLLFEIPGAVIVERWSARKWIARIMITWGIVTILTGFIRTPGQFYAARLLLGAAESSFFPGVIVFLTHWFRAADRAKAIAFFYSAVPAASVAGSLVAGWLLGVHWSGVAGWRWIFIVEGIAPIVLGFITIFYLADHPKDARWLPRDERAWIEGELKRELEVKKSAQTLTIGQALREKRVLLLMLPYSFALCGHLAVVYWIPTFVRRMWEMPVSHVAWWVALPGLTGIAGMLFNGWHSDETGERRWHAAVPLLVGSLVFLALPWTHNFGLAMALLTLGGVTVAYLPVFWSMPTLFLSESAAAASFGLINTVGQIGGFVGSWMVGILNQSTGRLNASFLFIGGCLFIAGLLHAGLRIRFPASAETRIVP